MGRRASREITDAEIDELLAQSSRTKLARKAAGSIHQASFGSSSTVPSVAVEVVKTTVKTLTTDEERQRQELEAHVEQAFYVAGAALTILRDQRLYRSTHPSFESYCRDRFGHSRQKAHFLIAAAAIYQRLSTTGCPILPANERQIRPLSLLEPNQQALAWNQAVSEVGGKIPSGRLVRRIVQELQPPTQQLPLKPNEVVQILVKENPDLSGKNKCWGIIRAIEGRNCQVACWDGQYQIPVEHLQKLEYSAAQRKTLAKLEKRLRRFHSPDVVVEDAAYSILAHLGKLEHPGLTELEDKLLGLLEQEYKLT